MLSVTVLNPRAAGWLTAVPAGAVGAAAGAALNWSAGAPVTGPVVLPLSPSGTVTLINQSSGAIDLQVDVMGYIRAGTPKVGSLVPLQSARIVDSRSGFGWPSGPGPMPVSTVVTTKITGKGGIPTDGVSAVLLAITAVAPARTGALRITDLYGGSDEGISAAVSFAGGQNRTGLVLAPVATDGVVGFHNPGPGAAHLVVDVVGYIQGPPPEPPMRWSPPAATASGLTEVSGLDCPTPTSCVAIDQAGGSATFDGSTWQPVPAGGLPLGARELSCATPTYCLAAVTRQPAALALFDGAQWRPIPAPASGDARGVACAAPTFCVVIDGTSGNLWTWNGTVWSAPTQLVEPTDSYPYAILLDVSCATPTFCGLVATRGASWIFDGETWNEAALVRYVLGFEVTCPVAGFCVTLEDYSQDRATVYNHGVYSHSALTWEDRFSSVSCADERFCVAVGGTDRITTWDGTKWPAPDSPPQIIQGEPAYISCPTHELCVALQYDGQQIIGQR